MYVDWQTPHPGITDGFINHWTFAPIFCQDLSPKSGVVSLIQGMGGLVGSEETALSSLKMKERALCRGNDMKWCHVMYFNYLFIPHDINVFPNNVGMGQNLSPQISVFVIPSQNFRGLRFWSETGPLRLADSQKFWWWVHISVLVDDFSIEPQCFMIQSWSAGQTLIFWWLNS